MPSPRIEVFDNESMVAAEVASMVMMAAVDAINQKGYCTMCLAGGGTPRVSYQVLSTPPDRDQIDWESVEVYFGDERCVPPESEESNYRMARENLLGRVKIPEDNVFRIQGEMDPEAAAAEYCDLLAEKFQPHEGLDVCILGMGTDGHTASLFPNTAALKETSRAVVANHTADGKPRITMTPPFLNKSRHVLVICTGEEKADTLKQVLQGDPDPDKLPIQLIQPKTKHLTFLLDAAAASKLD
ncbi:MAG: 6-phosphogluconolactonase [Phycisphaerae bacterium]